MNLFTNLREAAANFSETPTIFDESLLVFPESGPGITYKKCCESVLKRAYQLTHLGVKPGDKVIIYKSSAFDTYLLVVPVSYLGAVPAMTSYHLPTITMEVFISRLEDPFILSDDETKKRTKGISNGTKSRQIPVLYLMEQPALSVSQSLLDKNKTSCMTHTSGTIGISKLICHSVHSMGWRTKWQRTVFTKISEKKLIAFHTSPVYSRFNIGISSLMSMGSPMMPLANAQSSEVVYMLEAHRPITLEAHLNNFIQRRFTAKEHPEAFSGIRRYHSTFDAINNQTIKTFLRTLTAQDVVFLQVYGQSEYEPMILKAYTLESPKTSDTRDMDVGLEDMTSARITDSAGNVLPENTDGHIQLLSKERALTYYKEDAWFQENVYGDWWNSGDYGFMGKHGHLFLKDRQVDLIETINSALAIEDFLLDSLGFLAEVVIARDKNRSPQPIIVLAPDKEMDWNRWWEQVHEFPRSSVPIIRDFDTTPRTAIMKVQQLQIEKELKPRKS